MTRDPSLPPDSDPEAQLDEAPASEEPPPPAAVVSLGEEIGEEVGEPEDGLHVEEGDLDLDDL
jgi:hypothetical protein